MNRFDEMNICDDEMYLLRNPNVESDRRPVKSSKKEEQEEQGKERKGTGMSHFKMNICGLKYRVDNNLSIEEIGKAIREELTDDEKEKRVFYLGYHDTVKQEIHIAKEMTFERIGMTLLHEILEAIDKMFDLDLDHRTITVLEVALAQVLKNNFGIDFSDPFKAEIIEKENRRISQGRTRPIEQNEIMSGVIAAGRELMRRDNGNLA